MLLDKVYADCSELPIFNFFKIIDENDYKYLFKENIDKVYIDDFLNQKLHAHFKKILAEYNGLTKNDKLIKEYQAKFHIDFLEFRYNITNKCISLYMQTNSFEVVLLLKELGWQINSAKDVISQVLVIKKRLLGIKNQIKIAKSNFVNKYGNKKSKTETSTDVEKMCISLEVGIPLSYKINIYEDSIKRFIHYSSILERKNTKQNG